MADETEVDTETDPYQCVRHLDALAPFVEGLALTQWNNEIISTRTPVQYES